MKIIKDKFTWIDIINPTPKDVEYLRKIYPRFHPVILDELLHTSARSMVERDEHYLFFTYHLPTYDSKTKTSQKTEIDFLVTKNVLITVHYEEMDPLNDFFKKLNQDKEFKKMALRENTGNLIYYLIEELLRFSQRQLRHIEEDVFAITKELFRKEEEKLLEKISYIKRNILDYRIITKPQEIILYSLKEAGTAFWSQDMRIYFSDLMGDHLKVMQQLDNFKETVESLEATNAQLLTAKTNAVVQRFSVIAFLTFPLILVIGLFTVPAIDRIFENSSAFFAIAFIGALAFIIGLFALFRNKKWL